MILQKILPVMLLSISSVLLVSCGHEDLEKKDTSTSLPEAQVKTAKVTEQTAPNQVELVGTVEAVDKAEISAKISGNILQMPVELGSVVKKGELLAELSAGEIAAQLQQSKAQLEQAKRNLKREQKLLKNDAGTLETVKSLKDSLRIAEAAFLEAQTMLNYTKIPAPFDGTITHKFANAGDLATPGKPLLQIETKDKLQIVTDIPEAMIHKINLGDEFTAHIPAIETTITAVVTEISPAAEPSSRTTPIKMSIPVEPDMRSGQFIRVSFTTEKQRTLTIPQNAIVTYGQLERVFVVKDNKADLRLIRTGSIIKKDNAEMIVEVLSGLERGEKVVVEGNSSLQSGQMLDIK